MLWIGQGCADLTCESLVLYQHAACILHIATASRSRLASLGETQKGGETDVIENQPASTRTYKNRNILLFKRSPNNIEKPTVSRFGSFSGQFGGRHEEMTSLQNVICQYCKIYIMYKLLWNSYGIWTQNDFVLSNWISLPTS